jgi:hypothetical protein
MQSVSLLSIVYLKHTNANRGAGPKLSGLRNQLHKELLFRPFTKSNVSFSRFACRHAHLHHSHSDVFIREWLRVILHEHVHQSISTHIAAAIAKEIVTRLRHVVGSVECILISVSKSL